MIIVFEITQPLSLMKCNDVAIQRTLTVGGRITVQLVSSLTRLKLTNEGNIILFVLSEAV